MGSEKNPYQSPTNGEKYEASSETLRALQARRIFKYSYFTSLVVALTVVTIWLVVLFRAAPPGQARNRPPDVLEVVFVFATTLPSVVTCLCFSTVYCFIVRTHEDHKMWPAVLFGVLSGLMFNAMTAITVIEHLFDW